MNNYYIPFFSGKEKFNYLPILYLYRIAEYNPREKIYDKITVQSFAKLTEKINAEVITETKDKKKISKTTIYNILHDSKYNDFFTYDREKNEIILKNNFKKKEKRSFIFLTKKEFDFLLQQNDILLTRYYFYLRYYCGISKKGTTDNTAKQFLAASGYSVSSGSYVSKISEYNKLLFSNGMIFIQKIREDGKERNIYSIL